MVTMPLLFQNAGWFTYAQSLSKSGEEREEREEGEGSEGERNNKTIRRPTLCLVSMCVLGTLASAFLCEAISALPGNHQFEVC
jgi:hypothetical protein